VDCCIGLVFSDGSATCRAGRGGCEWNDLDVTGVMRCYKSGGECADDRECCAAGLMTHSVPRYYVLNLKWTTSPSCTIYSFPSSLNFPASLIVSSLPE